MAVLWRLAGGLPTQFKIGPIVLMSAAETFDLQIACTSSEIQTLLRTQYPTHFADLVHRIFNASANTGVDIFFTSISSGLVIGFQSVLGIIPSFFHLLFPSIFGGFLIILLIAGCIIIIIVLIRNGPIQLRNFVEKD